MNTIAIKLRQGRGPVWGLFKRGASAALRCHVPVFAVTRPFFSGMYALHVAAREGAAWGLRFFWYEPLFRSQCAQVGAGFRMERLPYIVGRGSIRIGRGVRLSGKSSFGFGRGGARDPEIDIGDGTFIGHDCGFGVASSVTIGKRCLLAGGVRVRDYDGHPVAARDRREGGAEPADGSRPVVIGDDVWIGADAVILKGVSIGDRAVVGAGAVVTRNVPSDSIVAGNPARVVRMIQNGAAA